MDSKIFQSKISKIVKAEKIHLTLTLAEVDALVNAGHYFLDRRGSDSDIGHDTESALQKLDEAVA